MTTFKNPLDAIDWLLATKPCGEAFGHVVSAENAGRALQRIQRIAKQDGSPSEMAQAWQTFQACMGPSLVHAIFSTGEWREACPTSRKAPTAPPLDDVMTVWSSTEGERVVAENKGGYYLFVVE